EERFLAPKSMIEEIRAALREAGKPLPANDEELLFCVHHSLALCYRDAVRALEKLIGTPFQTVHIVGGGCQNRTLNQLTADALGLRVLAGPLEATALGNIMAQWIATGELAGVDEARALIRKSFTPEEFLPRREGLVHDWK
ncbi:MAG: FGGY-family carbohydrate kinase, partial [Eubacteriales bacterium]|nr:FGGY-family carbohydrate kinase [Eubacteriales bacterium]